MSGQGRRNLWEIVFWVSIAVFWVLSFALARSLLELLIGIGILLVGVASLVWARKRIRAHGPHEPPPAWVYWFFGGVGLLVALDAVASEDAGELILNAMLLLSLLALLMSERARRRESQTGIS